MTVGEFIKTWIFPIIVPAMLSVWGAVISKRMRESERKAELAREEARQRELERKQEEERKASEQAAIQEYQAAANRAIRRLLGFYIYERSSMLIERGWATPSEKRLLESVYESYVELKGNGTGKSMYHDVQELPITPPVRENKEDNHER